MLIIDYHLCHPSVGAEAVILSCHERSCRMSVTVLTLESCFSFWCTEVRWQSLSAISDIHPHVGSPAITEFGFETQTKDATGTIATMIIMYHIIKYNNNISRLNCSTHQVKKFSKTTQNLMAKNKIDSLVHTRQVVDEIRHLTKTLNINKCNANRPDSENAIWCNINWGDNAPYWNQYYKIVKEYNYPFEVRFHFYNSSISIFI